MTAIREGPDLCMAAKAVDLEHKHIQICRNARLSSQAVQTLMGQEKVTFKASLS